MHANNERKSEDPQSTGARKRQIIIGIGAFSLVAAILIATYVYIRFIHVRPEVVLENAVGSVLADGFADSPVGFSGSLTTSQKTENIRATFSGYSENGLFSGRGSRQFSTTINLNSAGQSIAIKADVITTQQGDVYIKPTNLQAAVHSIAGNPNLVYGEDGEAYLKGVITKYQNKWIKLSDAEARQAGLDFLLPTGECTAERQTLRFDTATIDGLKKAYRTNPFLVVDQNMAKEQINGRLSFHFQVSMNQEKYMGFTEEMKTAPAGKALHACTGIIPINEPKNTKVELWVDVISRELTQLVVTQKSGEGTSEYRLSLADAPKESQVKVPAEATDVAEFRSDLEAALGVGLRQVVPAR